MNNDTCFKVTAGLSLILLLSFLAAGCGKKEGSDKSDKSAGEKKPAASTPCEKLALRVAACRKTGSKALIKKLVLRTCNREMKNEQTKVMQEKINACLEKSACDEFLKCREAGMKQLRDHYFKKASAGKKGHPALPIFRCACKDLACAKTKGMAGGQALKQHRSYIGTPAEEAELKSLLLKFKACLNKLKTQPRK
jgi:hypothetical protein